MRIRKFLKLLKNRFKKVKKVFILNFLIIIFPALFLNFMNFGKQFFE